MLPLTALYFPQTAPSIQQVTHELVFFDKILYYQATEAEKTATAATAAALWEGYAPVPFHDDLGRFRQLIRELKGNEAEFYSGQLSTLAAAKDKNRDEQSVKSLIQSIGGKSAAASEEQARLREELWQARLLLKLAEILHEEEQELQQELAAISVKEQELYEALKGEPEIAFTLSPPRQMESRPPVRPEILVKAWARLFLADRRQGDYTMLVSGLNDAADMVFDANESLTGKRPVRLFRIPLPASGDMAPAAYDQARAAFRQEAAETLAGFRALLPTTAAEGLGPDTLKNFSALAAQWSRIFNSGRVWGPPAAKPGQQTGCQAELHLEVYLCNESLPRLLAHVCKATVQPPAAGGNHLAIIAMKSHRKSTCKG
ncbi:MAG: hypothetical protein AB1461_03850 [Thermodesulfobacteriota bacterium]